MKRGDILVGLWVAMSAALITQVDFDSLNLPNAKAQESKPKKYAAKCEDRGDAFTPTGAREVAYCIASRKHGWKGDELVALNSLLTWESGFSYKADNPISHAYGIGQCMTNLHSECDTKRYFKNPNYQIRWTLRYIDLRYDFPSTAWAQHQARCSSALSCWY